MLAQRRLALLVQHLPGPRWRVHCWRCLRRRGRRLLSGRLRSRRLRTCERCPRRATDRLSEDRPICVGSTISEGLHIGEKLRRRRARLYRSRLHRSRWRFISRRSSGRLFHAGRFSRWWSNAFLLGTNRLKEDRLVRRAATALPERLRLSSNEEQ